MLMLVMEVSNTLFEVEQHPICDPEIGAFTLSPLPSLVLVKVISP
jgi:hypothetical protein